MRMGSNAHSPDLPDAPGCGASWTVPREFTRAIGLGALPEVPEHDNDSEALQHVRSDHHAEHTMFSPVTVLGQLGVSGVSVHEHLQDLLDAFEQCLRELPDAEAQAQADADSGETASQLSARLLAFAHVLASWCTGPGALFHPHLVQRICSVARALCVDSFPVPGRSQLCAWWHGQPLRVALACRLQLCAWALVWLHHLGRGKGPEACLVGADAAMRRAMVEGQEMARVSAVACVEGLVAQLVECSARTPRVFVQVLFQDRHAADLLVACDQVLRVVPQPSPQPQRSVSAWRSVHHLLEDTARRELSGNTDVSALTECARGGLVRVAFAAVAACGSVGGSERWLAFEVLASDLKRNSDQLSREYTQAFLGALCGLCVRCSEPLRTALVVDVWGAMLAPSSLLHCALPRSFQRDSTTWLAHLAPNQQQQAGHEGTSVHTLFLQLLQSHLTNRACCSTELNKLSAKMQRVRVPSTNFHDSALCFVSAAYVLLGCALDTLQTEQLVNRSRGLCTLGGSFNAGHAVMVCDQLFFVARSLHDRRLSVQVPGTAFANLVASLSAHAQEAPMSAKAHRFKLLAEALLGWTRFLKQSRDQNMQGRTAFVGDEVVALLRNASVPDTVRCCVLCALLHLLAIKDVPIGLPPTPIANVRLEQDNEGSMELDDAFLEGMDMAEWEFYTQADDGREEREKEALREVCRKRLLPLLPALLHERAPPSATRPISNKQFQGEAGFDEEDSGPQRHLLARLCATLACCHLSHQFQQAVSPVFGTSGHVPSSTSVRVLCPVIPLFANVAGSSLEECGRVWLRSFLHCDTRSCALLSASLASAGPLSHLAPSVRVHLGDFVLAHHNTQLQYIATARAFDVLLSALCAGAWGNVNPTHVVRNVHPEIRDVVERGGGSHRGQEAIGDSHAPLLPLPDPQLALFLTTVPIPAQPAPTSPLPPLHQATTSLLHRWCQSQRTEAFRLNLAQQHEPHARVVDWTSRTLLICASHLWSRRSNFFELEQIVHAVWLANASVGLGEHADAGLVRCLGGSLRYVLWACACQELNVSMRKMLRLLFSRFLQLASTQLPASVTKCSEASEWTWGVCVLDELAQGLEVPAGANHCEVGAWTVPKPEALTAGAVSAVRRLGLLFIAQGVEAALSYTPSESLWCGVCHSHCCLELLARLDGSDDAQTRADMLLALGSVLRLTHAPRSLVHPACVAVKARAYQTAARSLAFLLSNPQECASLLRRTAEDANNAALACGKLLLRDGLFELCSLTHDAPPNLLCANIAHSQQLLGDAKAWGERVVAAIKPNGDGADFALASTSLSPQCTHRNEPPSQPQQMSGAHHDLVKAVLDGVEMLKAANGGGDLLASELRLYKAEVRHLLAAVALGTHAPRIHAVLV